MSEAKRSLFTPSFNRAVKIRQGDSRLTSHAGAIILREADHRLGLIESVVEQMVLIPAIRTRFATRSRNCCGSGSSRWPWAKSAAG